MFFFLQEHLRLMHFDLLSKTTQQKGQMIMRPEMHGPICIQTRKEKKKSTQNTLTELDMFYSQV